MQVPSNRRSTSKRAVGRRDAPCPMRPTVHVPMHTAVHFAPPAERGQAMAGQHTDISHCPYKSFKLPRTPLSVQLVVSTGSASRARRTYLSIALWPAFLVSSPSKSAGRAATSLSFVGGGHGRCHYPTPTHTCENRDAYRTLPAPGVRQRSKSFGSALARAPTREPPQQQWSVHYAYVLAIAR